MTYIWKAISCALQIQPVAIHNAPCLIKGYVRASYRGRGFWRENCPGGLEGGIYGQGQRTRRTRGKCFHTSNKWCRCASYIYMLSPGTSRDRFLQHLCGLAIPIIVEHHVYAILLICALLWVDFYLLPSKIILVTFCAFTRPKIILLLLLVRWCRIYILGNKLMPGFVVSERTYHCRRAS